MHQKIKKILMAASLAIAVSIPATVWATDKTDITVGLKTLPLLSNKISGAAVMAVIYDPANAASKADADSVVAAVGDGIDAPGGVKVTTMLVATSELSKLSQVKLAFIAGGLKNSFDQIAAAAASNGVLTMSTDLDCVKSGKCVLGIVSTPSVDIYFSKTAADNAKIGFASAFAMLAKQV